MIKNFILSSLVLLALQSFSQENILFDAMTGPTGGRVIDIESNGSLDFFAISDDKLYRSIDNAVTWQDITPDNGNTGLVDVFVDNSDKVYLLDKTTVWTSLDNGTTWTSVTATGAYNPRGKLLKNPNTGSLFCMDNNNFGLMRSTNDGASWTQVYDGSSAQLRDYTIGNTGIIFIGTNGGSNLYKSSNDGLAFVDDSDPGLTNPNAGTVTNIEVNKSNGKIYLIYFATQGIFVSTGSNNGTAWAQATVASPITFPAPDNNWHSLIPSKTTDRIYVRDGQDLYYSDNALTGAGTWTKLNNYNAGNNEFLVGRALSSANILMGLGEDGIYGSTTSGASWSYRDGEIYNNRTRSFIRTNNGNLLAVNGGSAISFSSDGGVTWTKQTLCSSCNFSTLIKKPNGNILAIGSKTYGSLAANGGSPGSWTDLGGPPPSANIERSVSFDGDLIWGIHYETDLYRSVDGGVTFTTPLINGLPSPLRAFRVALSASNDLLVWTDTDEIYKVPATAGTPPFTATKITNTGLVSFRGIKGANGKIYVFGYDNATNSEAYAKSSNGGTTWTRQDIDGSNEVFVVNDDIMFNIEGTGGDQATISFSNDAGANWFEVFNGTYYDSEIAGAALDQNGIAYLVISGAALRRSQTAIVKPAKPTNLKVIGLADKEVFLEWDYSTAGGAFLDYYEIERKLTSGGVFEKVGETDGNEFYYVDRTPSKNTAYDYRLVAGNLAGETISDPISVTTKDDCPTAIPDNRSWLGEVSPGAISTGNPIAIRKISSDYYSISEVTEGSLVGVARNGGGTYSSSTVATFFNDACGTPFISVKNDVYPNGNGIWNGIDELTLNFQINKGEYTDTEKTITLTLSPTDPAPAVPANVSAYTINDTQIQLQWAVGDYQQKYIIERSPNDNTAFVPVGTVNYPTHAFTDSGPFTAGTTYFYRVKAENINMVASAYSAEISITFNKPIFILSNTIISSTFASAPSAAWGDLDDDGFEDLIMPKLNITEQTLAEPFLFKNNAGTDFQLLTGKLPAGTSLINPAIADYNNDGKLDVFIAAAAFEGSGSAGLKNVLVKNDGNFDFTNIDNSITLDQESGQSTFSSNWVDVNSNGFLDLFIPYQDANGQKLFAGNADGIFTENTAAGGLITDSFSKGPAFWADYDNDGDQDVFILSNNNSDPNRLYRNTGGVLTRVSPSAFDTHLGNFFTASWGDYNNDQFVDLFVGDQEGGKNYLYKNNGDGTFTKVADTPNSPSEAIGSSTAGSAWGDVDNDGDLDLLVASAGEPNLFYLNQGNGTFTKVTNELIAGYNTNFNLAAAFADYNNDGHLDVVIGALNFPLGGGESGISGDDPQIKLYKNNLTTGNWIKIKLNGAAGPQSALSNRSAIGARLKVVAGGKTQVRDISTLTGFGSQNSLIAHFGLGAETTITSLEVKFPSGTIKTLTDVAANQLLVIDEDAEGPQVAAFTPKNRDKGFAAEEISITANDAVSVASLNIVYRPIGGKDFTTQALSKVGATNEWKVSVQEAWYDDMGLEFYFEAADPFGNTTRSPASTNYYSYFNYKEANAPKFPTTSLVFGGTESTWNIVSIPFDLGTSATVTAVLDELGAFDNTQWRLLTYQNQTAWAEFPSTFSSFTRGKGYFLNVKTPPSAGITIASEILSPQNNQSALFSMALNQGWNQIGNPYLVNVNWADVKAFNAGISGVGDLKVYNSNGRSYGDGSVLSVYGGGFVFANEAVPDYKISFTGQTSGGRKGNAGRIASTELDADNWRTKFTLKQSDVTFTLGGIGMNPEAKVSYDDFDDVTVPRLSDFLEMNFHHPEHFAKRFSRDVVPTQDEYTWEFTVDSNLEGLATLNWDNTGFGVNENELCLFDVAQQQPINMREALAYTFDANTSSLFRVYFGENLAAKIQPEKIKLGKAYPNPTSGRTTIPFTLPETTGSYHVRLEVYDGVGRRVDVLRNEILPAGFYESEWNSSNKQFSNGLYTYRLVVAGDRKNEVYTDKIILNK